MSAEELPVHTFRVLGSLSVDAADDTHPTPTAPKVAQTLALLLLRHDKVVSTATLAEELWEDTPPRSASTTMQTYVYQLRKILGDDVLRTEGTGYVLRTGGHVDVARFDQLVAQGRQALGEGQLEDASRILREALAQWDGDVLANLEHGPVMQAHATELTESRLRALEMRIQADFALERYRDLIAELRFLVLRHPYHEWFHAQLIDALQRSGRRSEALQAFQHLRSVLAEDLGLEPSRALKDLEMQVLTA